MKRFDWVKWIDGKTSHAPYSILAPMAPNVSGETEGERSNKGVETGEPAEGANVLST
jgi:hypothetical protein